MTETENSSAMPGSTPISAASGRAYMPPLTRASLTALCDAGGINPAVWQKAMDYCGFRPDGPAWLAYWRQLCLLGGALFFVAGVVCFIAWNWNAMTPLARMALTGAVVVGSGLGAVLLGPDTRLGRVLLLVCGLGIGPMLAVFGQTYQTGAELWELFRVWTAVLVLLALAGRQTGLWFAAWLVANMFGALWLGRGLTSPLEALGQTIIVPEWLVVIACAIVCWEWAAYRAARLAAYRAASGVANGAGTDPSQAAQQPWFCSRWMPRMLYFDLVSRTAFFLHCLINGLGHSPKFSPMLLPGNFVVGFAVVLAGLSWWWYRMRQPDLFMLASLLAAGAAVMLSGLAEAGLFNGMGTTAPLLLWGLLVTGMTAGLAKILLHLQVSMAKAPRREAEAVSFPPSIFGRTVAGASWQSLWAQLQADRLVPQQQSLAETLTTLGEQPSPWYVRAMLAFGGWVAAVLFICFFGFLLFSNLHISSNEELIIFVASLPVLVIGRLLLPRGQMFARHFGFATAIAGTIGVSFSLCLSVTPEGLACFALAAVLCALSFLMRNAGYTGLAAVVIGNSVAMGIAFYFGHMGNGYAAYIVSGSVSDGAGGGVVGPVGLLSLWWTLVCAGLAQYCLREAAWRGAALGPQAEAWFYGLYTSALIFQICTLAPAYSLTREMGLPGLTAGYMGLGAALAVAALAFYLSRGAAKAGRLLALAAISLVFALTWYLPGVGLALLGLVLARQMGSVVMQGFVLAYLFAYMVFYYYSLAVPFSLKSLYLVATGLGLLAVALVLRLWQAKHTAGEAGHA